MQNKIQEGRALDFAAPYDLSSGDGFMVGKVFAVATGDAASGGTIVGERYGVFDLKKAATQPWTAYTTPVYWDATNKVCTSVATNNVLIGVAAADAASSATGTTGQVLLVPSVVV